MAGAVTVSVAVLAGGRSRRMGRDKRFLPIEGQPLLARSVAAASDACGTVLVVVADETPLPPLTGSPRVVTDHEPGEGPLGGLLTALAAAGSDIVVVVPGDHPGLVPAVLRLLVRRLVAGGADAVVLGDPSGTAQPLVGAYRRTSEAALRASFAAGERRARAVLDHLDVDVLHASEWQEYDRSHATLVDLDTPGDVARLVSESLAAAPPATEVTRLRHGPEGLALDHDRDQLAPEEPLLIRAGGPDEQPIEVVTTMRSPGSDPELAIGWLFTEGLYDPRRGPATVEVGDPLSLSRPEDTITVTLPHPLPLGAAAHRHTVATASCGVCGRASIDELAARCAPVPLRHPTTTAPIEWLLALPELLRDAQSLFAATGGVHATGLYDLRGDGRLLALREDVGRHNALDAAIGARLVAGQLDFGDTVAALSGRIGFELVAKAAVAGIPIVVAVGAPTDLAVRTAERLGISLLGFVREDRGNVYTHAERISADRPGGPGAAD